MQNKDVAAVALVAVLLIVGSLDVDVAPAPGGANAPSRTERPSASARGGERAKSNRPTPVDPAVGPGVPSAPPSVASAPTRAPHASRAGGVAAEPAGQDTIDDYVRERRRTDTAGLVEEALPDGGVQVDLQSRFRVVPVAVVTDDGELRIEE